MICPNCSKDIPDTAVRCRYCRKPVHGAPSRPPVVDTRKIFRGVREGLRWALFSGTRPVTCPWNWMDVAAVSVVIGLFVFTDPFHIGAGILRFLRLHFFVFTKEAKLLMYVAVYVNTVILKILSLLYIAVLVKARKVSFWRAVITPGKVGPEWKGYLALFALISLGIRMVNSMNPLVPNIPFNSVFFEARFIGNLVVIFSVIFVAPVVEEVLFRGFLFPALNRYMGVYPAILFTSGLFTMAHYPRIREDYLFMGVIFFLSVMITWAKARTGSTELAIFMHHIYNLISVAAGFGYYIALKY